MINKINNKIDYNKLNKMKIQFLSRRMHFTFLCHELEKKGIECDEIPLARTRNFLTLPTLYYLKQIQSDLIVTHNPFHGLYGASIAKKMNKAKHIAFRLKADHWRESSSSKVRFKNKLGYKIKMLQYENSKKNIDFVLAISDWMKNIAIKNGIKKPIYTMYNGVDTQRFFQREPNEKFKTEILSVMNFNVPEKIELLKKFLYNYKKSGQSYKVTFVGDGIYLPMIKKYSKSEGLENTVVFKGWVNDIENYYSNCELVIHPSNLESFGMTVLEAGATQKPVIALRVGGVEETILENITGYLTNNISELIEKIPWIMERPDLRNEMGEKARSHIVENFSWEKVSKRFIDILKCENMISEV